MSARRRLVRTAGAVAAVAGTHQVLTGTRGVRGNHVDAADLAARNADSEIRFYAAWYVTSGLLMLRESARRHGDPSTARLLAGGWALGAAGRVLSMHRLGRPHPVFVGLTAAEIAMAAVLAAPDRDS